MEMDKYDENGNLERFFVTDSEFEDCVNNLVNKKSLIINLSNKILKREIGNLLINYSNNDYNYNNKVTSTLAEIRLFIDLYELNSIDYNKFRDIFYYYEMDKNKINFNKLSYNK